MKLRFIPVFIVALVGMTATEIGSTHSSSSMSTRPVRIYLPRDGASHRDNPFNLQSVWGRVTVNGKADFDSLR